MASEQVIRSENTTNERDVEIEKDKVPKMASHFEHLLEQARDPDVAGVTSTPLVAGKQSRDRNTATGPYSVGKFEVSNLEAEGGEIGTQQQHQQQEQPSLDEVSILRQTAQQNSLDAIRAAEERYNKAKKEENDRETKNQHQPDASKQEYSGVTEKAKGYVAPIAEKTSEYAGAAKEYAGGKAAGAKDASVEGGKAAAGTAGKVSADVKDKAVAAGWAAAHFTTEKTVEGTKAAAKMVQNVAGYTGNKAAELASKPLGAAKEVAVSTGETLKEYTARKKEEAKMELEQKKSAEQTQTQIGLEGEDDRKSNLVEEQPEKGIEKDEQSFRSGGGGGGVKETMEGGVGGEAGGNVMQESFRSGGGGGGVKETREGGVGGETGGNVMQESFVGGGRDEKEGSGIVGAIGETFIEIAQATKDLVLGEDEQSGKERGVGYGKQGRMH